MSLSRIKNELKTVSCEFRSGFTFKWILKNLLVFRDCFGIVDKSCEPIIKLKRLLYSSFLEENPFLVGGGKSSLVSFSPSISPWPFIIELEEESSTADPSVTLALTGECVLWENLKFSQIQRSLLDLHSQRKDFVVASCWIWWIMVSIWVSKWFSWESFTLSFTFT